METWDRQTAFKAFDLSPDKSTLMVTGGSLGARSINRALISILPDLLPEMQVVHLTGNLTWPEVEAAVQSLPKELADNYRPYPYLHERMGAAFTVADLVVSRAGASILGELPAYGTPAILIPYPHAWRYQKINADYLVNRQAAVVLADEDLSAKLLVQVRELMHNESKRGLMQAAMQALANPNAAKTIASLLREMASPDSQPTIQGGAL
jgi:UDP-N-acetylglucosamine--N-acetylmuramyl-(pentapeptide) pyrophosphoryl-undecaprenol N-acetylglucosamine transferase